MIVPQVAGSRPEISCMSADSVSASRRRIAGVARAMRPPTSLPVGSMSGLRFLRREFHRLLVLAHLRQRRGRDDVGDAAVRALLAVDAGGLAPARAGEAVLLAEQRQED